MGATISPDLQSFNRYSYCENDPVDYVNLEASTPKTMCDVIGNSETGHNVYCVGFGVSVGDGLSEVGVVGGKGGVSEANGGGSALVLVPRQDTQKSMISQQGERCVGVDEFSEAIGSYSA